MCMGRVELDGELHDLFAVLESRCTDYSTTVLLQLQTSLLLLLLLLLLPLLLPPLLLLHDGI